MWPYRNNEYDLEMMGRRYEILNNVESKLRENTGLQLYISHKFLTELLIYFLLFCLLFFIYKYFFNRSSFLDYKKHTQSYFFYPFLRLRNNFFEYRMGYCDLKKVIKTFLIFLFHVFIFIIYYLPCKFFFKHFFGVISVFFGIFSFFLLAANNAVHVGICCILVFFCYIFGGFLLAYLVTKKNFIPKNTYVFFLGEIPQYTFLRLFIGFYLTIFVQFYLLHYEDVYIFERAIDAVTQTVAFQLHADLIALLREHLAVLIKICPKSVEVIALKKQIAAEEARLAKFIMDVVKEFRPSINDVNAWGNDNWSLLIKSFKKYNSITDASFMYDESSFMHIKNSIQETIQRIIQQITKEINSILNNN